MLRTTKRLRYDEAKASLPAGCYQHPSGIASIGLPGRPRRVEGKKSKRSDPNPRLIAAFPQGESGFFRSVSTDYQPLSRRFPQSLRGAFRSFTQTIGRSQAAGRPIRPRKVPTWVNTWTRQTATGGICAPLAGGSPASEKRGWISSEVCDLTPRREHRPAPGRPTREGCVG